MSNIEEIINGSITANAFYGDGTGLTNITRSGLSLGTPNAVVVNNGSGAMTDIAILDPARGGTGINSSALTGLVTVTAGVWSAGAVIVNADIAPGAAIDRSKLANGTANHVVINNGSGVMSSEAQLSVARGGTGQNFSAVVGPTIPTISGGVWAATLGYAMASTPNTVAQRDGSANLFMQDAVIAGQAQTNTIMPYSGSTITMGSGSTVSVLRVDKQQMYVSATSAAEFVTRAVTTPSDTPTIIYSYTTAVNTAYTVILRVTARRTDSGATASFESSTRAKNFGATVSLTNYQITRSREVGLTTCTAQPVAAGAVINVIVTGVLGVAVNWTAEIEIIYSS